MRLTNFHYYILYIAFLGLGLISCRNQKEKYTIPIPKTPVYKGYFNYLVSTESYMRIYKERDITSEVLALAREGDIFILLKSEGQNEFGYEWYFVYRNNVQGWLLVINPILVYSQEQAQLFSRQLIEASKTR